MTRVIISLLGTTCLGLCLCHGAAGQEEFKDDPEAHALYDKMKKTLREASSLYFESDCRQKGRDPSGQEYSWHATHRIWLKKPNQFRVEATLFGSDAVSGVLVGDGEQMWIYWPGGKPRLAFEHSGELAEEYEKHRLTFYMNKPGSVHSIWHQIPWLGYGMAQPVLQPSSFHGYPLSFEVYLDGVRHSGTEAVGGEQCDVIEVSFMNHQRSWYLWLSRKDHLPRKLKEVTRVAHDVVKNEVWSNVAVGAEISDDKFAWSPPEGWKEWSMPPRDVSLLKPGTQAPDFTLASVDGRTIRLSDFRGSFVWLFKWRVGCPTCRAEIPEVQNLYAKYRNQGLVVLGVNTADAKETVTEMLEQNGVEFPNVLDTSPEAVQAMQKYETLGNNAVPMTYVIDREGKIMDAWYGGYQEKREAAIKKLQRKMKAKRDITDIDAGEK